MNYRRKNNENAEKFLGKGHGGRSSGDKLPGNNPVVDKDVAVALGDGDRVVDH